MPNRIIKESVTTSNEIDCLTAEEERFFYRLIVVCDDYGRMDARSSILRAKCFPLKIDSIKDKDIEKWLDALIKQDLVEVYIVGGKKYLQMSTWGKHQQKRAKYSKYPSPDEGMKSDAINCNQEIPNVPENTRIREYENTITRASEKKEAEALFDYLWDLYPRKKGKGSVTGSQKKKLKDLGKEHLERCIKRFKQDMAAESRPLDKYPYGSTFFNSGYIDYLDANYQEQEPRAPNLRML